MLALAPAPARLLLLWRLLRRALKSALESAAPAPAPPSFLLPTLPLDRERMRFSILESLAAPPFPPLAAAAAAATAAARLGDDISLPSPSQFLRPLLGRSCLLWAPVWMRLARLSMDCRLWKSSDMRASKLVCRSMRLDSDWSRASWLSWSRDRPVLSMRLSIEALVPPAAVSLAAECVRE